MYGQIVEIITPSGTLAGGAVVVLDLFGLQAAHHSIFGMPVLSRPSNDNSYLIVHVEVRQHMCPDQVSD